MPVYTLEKNTFLATDCLHSTSYKYTGQVWSFFFYYSLSARPWRSIYTNMYSRHTACACHVRQKTAKILSCKQHRLKIPAIYTKYISAKLILYTLETFNFVFSSVSVLVVHGGIWQCASWSYAVWVPWNSARSGHVTSIGRERLRAFKTSIRLKLKKNK